jgi:apolipoprotein N-acyltransferase
MAIRTLSPRGGRAFRLLLALFGGALIGVSLPPLGWWPLALVGAAAVFLGLETLSPPARFAAGMLAGVGQFFISLAWALQFNAAGYVVLSIVEALFFAFAALLVPSRVGRLAAFAGAFTLAEWAREQWPFGGLPLGGVALGQPGGPFAVTARLGGSLLVAGVVFLGGAVLGSALGWRRPVQEGAGRVREAAAGFVVVLALVLWATLSANGTGAGPNRLLTVALVQGGGKRGLNQLQVPPSVVFEAAVRETADVKDPVDLIVWPEDVVAMTRPFRGSAAERTLAGIARSHHATLVAGVTEPVGRRLFRNEIVAFSPAGKLVAVFEKVHRVPFGEYVPFRGFFKHFANLSAVPRDAIPGTGSGMIATPAGRFAVLVSYEVFFADRGRSGVRAGGEVILVPTNTSSYANDQAPSQEISASRLQAIEEGRYVLQVAPTGYSAVVDEYGDVLRQTRLSAPGVLETTVPELSGATIFERFGQLPVVFVAGVAVLVPGGISLRKWRRRGSVVSS